jgi:hypothetical protein
MVELATNDNLYVRVNPQWLTDKPFNNEKWASIVSMQLDKFPEQVDKETLAGFKKQQMSISTSLNNSLESNLINSSESTLKIVSSLRRSSLVEEHTREQKAYLTNLGHNPRSPQLLSKSTSSFINENNAANKNDLLQSPALKYMKQLRRGSVNAIEFLLKSVKEVVQEVAKDPTKDPVKEPAKEPAKEPEKESDNDNIRKSGNSR